MSGTNQYGTRDASVRLAKIRGSVRALSKQAGIQTTRVGGSGSFSNPASNLIDTDLIASLGNVTLGPSSSSTTMFAAPAPSTSVPGAPIIGSATVSNGQATVSFTPPSSDGGSTILYYTVTSTPGSITAYGSSSPITVLGLTNGTSYTFSVTATSAAGTSSPSAATAAATPTNSSSSAPTITSIIATNNSFSVSFTAPASFGTIANYEYSTDGGATFTALSPADAASPITIPSLAPTTTYDVAIRAVNNVPATGDTSNIVPVATKTTLVTTSFTTPGATTWTPPIGVRGVQYLVVGGGGGGGGCYSKITVLGNVPIQSTAPVGGGYWIYNGTSTSNYTNGRMYNGAAVNPNFTTFPDPIRLTASADLQPTGTSTASQKIYGSKELVYNWSSALPTVTNYGYPSYSVNSSTNNNASGGGGGGAGGQIRAIYINTAFYSVNPGTAYTVIVGDGGDGGTAATNTENAGSKGGDSTFDTITSEGGSGGQPSRVRTQNQDGFNNGGQGQTTTTNLIGGYGGQGSGGSGGQGLATTSGYAGAASLVGFMGDGVAFGGGGASGAPNTIASSSPVANRGYGGSGTGCALNSFASGVKGGSGLVKLKYYV